jgi:hypothetical protein
MSVFEAFLATVTPATRVVPLTVRGEAAPRTDAMGAPLSLTIQSAETPVVAQAMFAMAEAPAGLAQDEAMTAVCAAAVVGWHLVGPDGAVTHVECTPAAVRAFFAAARWAREPVMTALAEVEAFFARGASGSSTATAGA